VRYGLQAVPFLRYGDHRLAYTELGDGPGTLVLLHGQLLNQRMHEPLARDLAARGHRVVTLDLLGHGLSDRPNDMSLYSMGQFAEQVVALLDHLELDEAVIGGTSLGANVTLEFAVLAPERARGLMVEMPVLDTGVFGAVLAFLPMLATFKYGMPMVRFTSRLARWLPRDRFNTLGQIVVDAMSQDHEASAAILQGQFLGEIAPRKRLRERIEVPALVIGHGNDPIHPLQDSAMLASELRDSRLVQANSIFELRLHPERLTEVIAGFLDDCWKPRRARAGGNGRRRRAG
jgi:pimeloyl-ACP methyl ester carboxylesterase